MGWPDKMGKEIEIDMGDLEGYLKDTERAIAIMGGSLISFCLENMLEIIMIDDPIVNELFESPRCLETLAAKIDCAYAFGLIDKQTKDDLTYIRKIRNEFAHAHETLSFNDSPIRDWCQELSAAKNKEIETAYPRRAFVYTLNKTVKLSGFQRQKLKKKLTDTKSSE